MITSKLYNNCWHYVYPPHAFICINRIILLIYSIFYVYVYNIL